jgi:hypothetical protein
VGVDSTGAGVGSMSGNYGTTGGNNAGTTAVTGSITSGGNTTISTARNVTLEGTNLRSGGDMSITSTSGAVDFRAARDTASSQSSSESYSGSISGSKSDTKSGSGSFSMATGNESSSSSTARAGSIVSGGNVTVQAGTGANLTMEGTDIAAGGKVGLSGTNVNLIAAESTSQSSGSSMSAGGSLGYETGKGKKGEKDYDPGGKQGSGQYSSGSQSGQSTTQRGAVITGREISITAGNDVRMQGTVVGARDSATVSAGGKLTMESAQDTSTSSNSGMNFGAGAVRSDGVGGHIAAGVSSGDSLSVVNRNAILSGGNVAVTTGGDARLAGANIAGGTVNTTIGGNLSVESRNDVLQGSASSFGGALGGASNAGFTNNSAVTNRGEFMQGGMSMQFGKSNTDVAAVNVQSGITGQQSTTVNVTGTAALTGARIGSSDAEGTTSLTARSVTQQGLEQRDNRMVMNDGVGARIGDLRPPSSTHTDNPSSSVLQSSVGGAPVQPTINIAQLGTVLNQPAVQTAMVLNRGMNAAKLQYGGADNVPADAMRKVLVDAGVPGAATATTAGLKTLFSSALESGYSAATTQLNRANVPPAQVDSILRSIIP